MVIKRVNYTTQTDSEDTVGLNPPGPVRSTEIESPKNKPQMKATGIPQIQMREVEMKSVIIFPVKMVNVVIL